MRRRAGETPYQKSEESNNIVFVVEDRLDTVCATILSSQNMVRTIQNKPSLIDGRMVAHLVIMLFSRIFPFGPHVTWGCGIGDSAPQ